MISWNDGPSGEIDYPCSRPGGVVDFGACANGYNTPAADREPVGHVVISVERVDAAVDDCHIREKHLRRPSALSQAAI